MNSGITSLAVGKSAQFKMQFKKSPSDSMSFFTADFSRHSENVKNIPCWKVLSHVSAYLSVTIRTWSARRSTILTSKAVHQHADGRARFFIAQILARKPKDNGISGWPDLYPLLYLSEFMDFSAESWHIVFLWLTATQRCGRHPKRQVSCCVMVSIALFYWRNYLIESCCPWHAIFPHVPPTWI